MPSTYAHRLFGEKMVERYPEEVREFVEKNRKYFDIGLHGPDVLFYYKPLFSNDVNSIGYSMHGYDGRRVFERIADCKDDGVFAYALGFLCHFALDSACHGYIENKIYTDKVYHTEIESEFDKYLLRQNGADPFEEDIISHISADEETAKAVAAFFVAEGETVSEKQALKALKSMIFYNNMIAGRNPLKRLFVNFILKISGQYPEMHGMMFSLEDIDKCEDSNIRLVKLMKKAEENCLEMTEEFLLFRDGKGSLGELYSPTFGPGEKWREIPVLNKDKEMNYEI